MPAKPSAAAIAAQHLRDTDNPGVGVGDTHLLHEIADKLGMEHDGFATEKRVLDRIDRSNQGELVKGYIGWNTRGRGYCRCFWLPDYYRKRWGEPPRA